MQGVSTEAALHQIIARVERTFKSGRLAIGVFLDIKGAFDKVNTAALVRGLQRFDINKTVVRFVSNRLSHRSVVASVDGVEATRNAETGCPQGGVLSPLLWNLVVEEEGQLSTTLLARLCGRPGLLGGWCQTEYCQVSRSAIHQLG
jgi:retron-type reverse transcriptase